MCVYLWWSQQWANHLLPSRENWSLHVNDQAGNRQFHWSTNCCLLAAVNDRPVVCVSCAVNTIGWSTKCGQCFTAWRGPIRVRFSCDGRSPDPVLMNTIGLLTFAVPTTTSLPLPPHNHQQWCSTLIVICSGLAAFQMKTTVGHHLPFSWNPSSNSKYV